MAKAAPPRHLTEAAERAGASRPPGGSTGTSCRREAGEEIARLRADNDELRQQVRDAVAMFDRASSAVGESRPRRRRRTAESTVLAAAPAAPARRRRPRGRAVKGRATPPEVTTEVVRAVIAKLGQGTAAEIASEITRAGVKVSGRAVRFLAERAGAETSRGDDGQRRYRL